MAAPIANGDQTNTLEQLHREMLADRAIQFKFEQPVQTPDPPDWLGPLARFIDFIAPYFTYFFWAGVIIVVGLILYTILNEILRRMPREGKNQYATLDLPKPEYRPSKQRAHALLEEADRLASEGRFAEAVRIILHRSIEDMETAFPGTIAPAMTSREIQNVELLSTQGRSTFSKIAAAVEASLFAGRALTHSQFIECRKAYEGFVFEKPA